MPATRLSARVVARLAQAEACELNPHYRDDLMIARLTVAYAASGEAVECSPHVLASYMVLGLHPEKVWPAIQARRKALGPLQLGASAPKKPSQSEKLWFEKTNGARAVNSRAGEALVLRDQTISVPMAAPSIAALYPNPDAPSSAKKRQLSLDELKLVVAYSGAPHSARAATLAALRARGPWPHQDGPATGIIQVSLLGMMIDGNCCRSTAQRRVRRACQLGYWRRTRDANSWNDCPKCGAPRSERTCGKCNYRGSRKNKGEFCPTFTYEINIEKFMATPRCREIHSDRWRSYAEYKASSRGEQANVTEMPRKPAQPAPQPDPPSTAAADPARAKPAVEHRRTDRPEPRAQQPKLTRRECAKFVANVEQRRRGRTSFFSRADGFMVALHPGEAGYEPPISRQEAFVAECAQWKREPDAVLHALKFWGYQVEENGP